MAVEIKRNQRQLDVIAEQLALEFNEGLKAKIDIDKLQEIFIHLLIATGRTNTRSNQLKKLDQHDAVMLKAKEIQNTYNSYGTIGSKALASTATVAAACCGILLGTKQARITPDITARMVHLIRSGSQNLPLFGQVFDKGSEVFTGREAAARTMLEAEMRAIQSRQDQLGTIVQQYMQRIESLLAKADQLLRQQTEAKRV